jgi:dUTP pyrophosphatase
MSEVFGKLIAGKLTKDHPFDAGLDIYANEDCRILARDSEIIRTGLFVEIPKGYVGLVWSKSGLSCKYKIEVGAGCIDYGYTGEVLVHLYNHGRNMFEVRAGTKIAQLITIPILTTHYVQVGTFSDSEETTFRGANGFGSTGDGRSEAKKLDDHLLSQSSNYHCGGVTHFGRLKEPNGGN